ncbi:MAG: TetR/AcrR family transcriptional regulator [Marmoricola sp.]
MPPGQVDPRPKQTRLRAPVRRERILEAALEIFSRHGYAASMGQIAEEAQITRTVLYYYFPAKKDLFVAVLESLQTAVVKHVAPALTDVSTDEERARAVVSALIGFAAEDPRSWRILFTGQDDMEPEVAEILATLQDMTRSTALLLLGDKIEELGFDLESPRATIMAELLFGGAVQVMRWWSAHPEVSRREVEDAIHQLVWEGVSGFTPAALD